MTRVLVAVLLSGCFHVRLNEKNGETVRETTFATPFTDAVKAEPCKATGTDLINVHVSSNLGYAWLSVVTFGIVNLVDVEYACAPQTGVEVVQPPAPDP
jgi:hypothetical protein